MMLLHPDSLEIIRVAAPHFWVGTSLGIPPRKVLVSEACDKKCQVSKICFSASAEKMLHLGCVFQINWKR